MVKAVHANTLTQTNKMDVCTHSHTHTHGHTHTSVHLVPVSPFDLFVWGQWLFQYAPHAISGQTHATAGKAPNAYQIIAFQPTTLAGSASYCNSPFIAFPQDFILYTASCTERSQSSFRNLRKLWNVWKTRSYRRDSSTSGWTLLNCCLLCLYDYKGTRASPSQPIQWFARTMPEMGH